MTTELTNPLTLNLYQSLDQAEVNDAEIKIFEKAEDDKEDLDSIKRMIKFYLYNKMQSSKETDTNACLKQTTPKIGSYLSNICDVFFDDDADNQESFEQTRLGFKTELETFKSHLIKNEISLLS